MLLDLPKVILHEHLEGSVTPQMAKQLARKNNITLPSTLFYADKDYDKTQFPYGRYQYDESQFVEFIRVYDQVAALIQTVEDYYLITKDFLSRNAKQGLVYCELLISPYHMCAKLIEGKIVWDSVRYYEILSAIEQAVKEVQEQHYLYLRLHTVGVRHLGPETVHQTLLFTLQHPHQLITGFNIAGNELSYNFDDFSDSHQLAEKMKLGCSYHAGEIGSDQSIIDAIKSGATRIGHGINAINNKKLIQQLIENSILLEISMTSNRILVPELGQEIQKHPIRKLYDLGVRIAINTDDAGIFGTDIDKEYKIAMQVFGFNRIELLDIALCSMEAAFIEDDIKQQIIKHIYSKYNPNDILQLQQYTETLPNNALKNRLLERLLSLSKAF